MDWKQMVLAALLCAVLQVTGCASAQQTDAASTAPAATTVPTPHPECQVQHVPTRPDGLTADSIVIWTGPQPSPNHVNVWLAPTELQKIAQYRQAMGVYPNLKGRLDHAEEQVRLWTEEPESQHRNAQLRQWTQERDRLKEEFGQLSLLLGQQTEPARPMPFQPARK